MNIKTNKTPIVPLNESEKNIPPFTEQEYLKLINTTKYKKAVLFRKRYFPGFKQWEFTKDLLRIFKPKDDLQIGDNGEFYSEILKNEEGGKDFIKLIAEFGYKFKSETINNSSYYMAMFEKTNKSLNESQQFEVPKQEINDDLLTLVMKTKSKQFEFDCGVIMANIRVPLFTRFGLQWHYMNSNSVETFLQSIENFIQASNNVLTENDCDRLIKQYNKKNIPNN